jgi:hypothetical protein
MGVAVVEQIIEAIADEKGVDPLTLEISLQNWIDVEAIQQLVNHGSETWVLEFELPDHTVTITGENIILVDGRKHRKLA